MPMIPGTVLGAYKVIATLGAGGMGVVYRAEDQRLGREVAIKVLPEDFWQEPDRVLRFEHEARAVSALNHPNILTIHGLETIDGRLCLISELLEGETLRQRMDGKPIPYRRAVDVALQIAKGLSAAHGKGIIHRDLKPENIFITKTGLVKILDFGLAKWQPSADSKGTEQTGGFNVGKSPAVPLMTMEGCVVGTVNYMSPEQVRGEPLDGRSDIFSLGVMLWEMLTGNLPFHGNSPIETMTSVLRDDPPALDFSLKLPESLDRIIHTCLAKHASARFHSAHDLAFALSEVASNGVSGASSRPYKRIWGVQKRFWTCYGLQALAWLIAVTSVLILLLHTDPPLPEFTRLTFRRGLVFGGRFAPDGRNVFYSATWNNQPWQVNVYNLDSQEDRSIGPKNAQLLALSSTGEVSYNLGILKKEFHFKHTGTLAHVPHAGDYAPRAIQTDVEWVDYDPSGQMVVVRSVNHECRMEYPLGHTIVTSSGWISHPRFSPSGDAIAYIQHPVIGDNIGSVCLWKKGCKEPEVLTKAWPGGAFGLAWHKNQICFTASERSGVQSLWGLEKKNKYKLLLRLTGDLVLLDVSAAGKFLMIQEDVRSGVATGKMDTKIPMDVNVKYWTVLNSLSPDGKVLVMEEQSESTELGYRIYKANIDGSDKTMLGEGMMAVLSPNQKNVAAVQLKPEPHLAILPIGVGRIAHLSIPGVTSYITHQWTANGKLVVMGQVKEQGAKIYLQDPTTGNARPLCDVPPAVNAADVWMHVSVDGNQVAFGDDDEAYRLTAIHQSICPMVPLCGYTTGDRCLGWSTDGAHVFMAPTCQDPVPIFTVDILSGKRSLWRSLDVKDLPSHCIREMYLTPDGKTWALRYRRVNSDLYLMEGIK